MGYEISVTPLQLAAAYGAIANGGVLMEPHLLRQIRAADGTLLENRQPRPLRRVAPEWVVAEVTKMLASVVQDGTATRAAIETFEVAGKTGTSRRTGPNGRYLVGSYTGTFVGYFPADDPQIVIFVKIDEPKGDYYGGLTAAPVTRETLQGILASRSSAVDVARLLGTTPLAATGGDVAAVGAAASRLGQQGTHRVDLAEPPVSAADERLADGVAVPELGGLPLREAALRAHSAGLRVRVRGSGSVARTVPEAGVAASRGDTLLLVLESE
jgi:cell division protein FtsI (penicillin-binding protein 3)